MKTPSARVGPGPARNPRTAFYPGTFDPLTFGHLDIIARAAALFERLVVGVAVNNAKQPLLTLAERLAMMEEETRGLPHADRIEVVGFSGLLVDAVHQHGAGTVVRGLRSSGDFDYESQLSGALKRLDPHMETVFLLASETHRSTASRIVKEIARLGGDIAPFVPAGVQARVLLKLRQAPISP
ncbi:pantetheine-phosphate adenylyltransferase [Formicincola oecophyllae]|uniref:Phosphopantetheine adenylyltransferase n=1 Tax=Formicincola oecophyllae TaxID=2558361 RepID=A0A4Y6U865_9PROT|nr:pantetheine-phosphate adenylyltransferase [Formicincola oecophyllae]QDH13364.1 pantetheine-phosphate adenylyltransferase [Formicincola oecophyllae]